jgi:AcrR family transcriptional regulator
MDKLIYTIKFQHPDIDNMATYETSLKTREALINAAGELAAEVGFASVSTRAIAVLAKENAGSIHYHFGSKEKLFEAMVQTVVQVWKDNPISELLKQYDTGTPQGQAQAVRAIVHRNIVLLFGRGLPIWHCRVIFQVVQNAGPLREIFKNELIKPSHNAIKALLKRIKPTINDQEAYLRILIMNTPVFFHADHMDFILAELCEKRYSTEYLQKMEEIIVLQTQLVLGLPPS